MNADRNLLLGVIALQNNLIDRHQLVTAFDRWVGNKDVSLAEHLQAAQAIGPDERRLLDALVNLHVSKHGGDPGASLAALSSGHHVAQVLQRIADQDVQASLGHLRAAKPSDQEAVDPLATRMVTPSQSLSASRFRVLRPHARGGLGEVFVAEDDELHRTVALKQIKDAHADDADSRNRFVVEAEITGALEHPGIVPVYGLGHYADGRPYYAMRFIRGDSLSEAIDAYHKARKARMPGGDPLALRGLLGRMIDVCEAIEYAHCRGILHRDLKPGNIMVGRFGETLVVDWGLARLMEVTEPEHTLAEGVLRPVSSQGTQHTMVGAAVGTPQYMSPEQAAGKLELLGPRSDVYSLGATLFCLLAGEAPVAGEDAATVMHRVQRGELKELATLNNQLDRPLMAICYKALSLDPGARYERAEDLARDLQRWLADEPVEAFPETWLSKAGRWSRRHRGLMATIAVAGLLLLSVLSVSLWLVSSARQREKLALNRATDSFRAARAAVDRYFTQVSESTLLNQPGVQPVRRQLLEDALQYYESFRQHHQDDRELLVDMARATFNVGRIQDELGNLTVAAQSYSDATAQLQQLLAKDAANTELIELNGDLLTARGRLAQKQDLLSESRQLHTQALQLRQQLAQADGKNLHYHRKLANSHMNLGVLSLMQSDWVEAEKAIEQAQGIRAPWLDHPDNYALKRDTAKGYYNLGIVAVQRERPDVAQVDFRKAIDLFQSLLVKDSADLEVRSLLATCFRLLGDLTAGGEETSAALQNYGQAIEILQTLSLRNPEVAEHRQSLAAVQMNLASIQPDTVQAMQTMSQAIDTLRELEKATPTVGLKRDLAIALRTRSEWQSSTEAEKANQDLTQSLEIWQQLVKDNPKNGEFMEELKATEALKSEAKR